jgi:anti-sigma-K factor RskA/sigma-70-like protein
VLGLVRSVLRDPAQSEEVTQEVLVEVWRCAAHFQPEKGSAMAWIMTLAHRRAVDRVRSAQASSDREQRAALLEQTPAFDEVTEQVESRLERESVALAYYRTRGCTAGSCRMAGPAPWWSRTARTVPRSSPPDCRRLYELWYADGGTMRPAGLLDGGDATTVLMDGKVDRATAMGVTVEPDGGSPQPTSDPLLLIPFGHGGGARA